MRLFVAVPFAPQSLDAFAEVTDRLRTQAVSGRFSPRENLHLTLAFLGETHRLEAAQRALGSVNAAPFPLLFRGLGCFPGKGGDLWWMGMEQSQALHGLQRQLTLLLAAQGFSPDQRPYRPHLTLGRSVVLPPGFDRNGFEAAMPSIPVEVEQIHLMESGRSQGQLTYISLLDHQLQ